MKSMSRKSHTKSQDPKKSSTCFKFFSLILILKQHSDLAGDSTEHLPSEVSAKAGVLEMPLGALNNLDNSLSLQ